jgi:formylglycine-generating enzyme required for sulfatase activity
LQMTSIVQNEFKQINPSGRQVSLRVIRNRDNTSDFGIVLKDLKVRYFGSKREFEGYQDSLTTLKVRLLKEATPLKVGALPTIENPPKGPPNGNFTNGAGLSMVQLPEGWWAGKFEVTQSEYENLMGNNPSIFKEPQHPVECVSWHDAMEFCRRLTELERAEGRLPINCVYRLPTAKEWDYFADGTDAAAAVLSQNEVLWQSAPVGSKKANPLGLHDVIGNVWEWCMDWSDPKQVYKASKGGAWINELVTLSPYPGSRNKLDVLAFVAQDKFFGPIRKDYPEQGFWDRGFRCVLAPRTP